MKFDKFQKKIDKLANFNKGADVLLPAFFLGEEVGECFHEIRHLVSDPEYKLDVLYLLDEMSDVLTAFAHLASGIGLKMDDIAEHALEKQTKRAEDNENQGNR